MSNTATTGYLLEKYGNDLTAKQRKHSEDQQTLSNAEELDPKERRAIQNRISRTRSRIDDLMNKKEEIAQLANPETHIKDFEKSKWGQRLVLLQDIETLDGFKETGEALRRLIWQKHIPNSRFKRFQEVFCLPEHFCIPQLDAVDGVITFREHQDIHEMPLEPLLMHLDRVPEKLLEDLGLVDFSDCKGDPVLRLKKKAEVLSRFKYILQNTRLVSDDMFRIFLIQAAHATESSMDADVIGAPPEKEGMILYTRDLPEGKDKKDKTGYRNGSVQFFDSGYNAHEKTFRQEDVYQHEIRKLSNLIADLKKLNAHMDTGWKKDKAAILKRANQLFPVCADELQFCEDELKVKANDQVENIQKHLEQVDLQKIKANVTVIMTRMTAVRVALQSRLKRMRQKGKHNQVDRQVLQEHINTSERTIAGYQAEVRLLADLLLENENILEEKESEELLSPFEPREIDLLHMAPFVSIGRKFSDKRDILETRVKMEDVPGTKNVLVEMHVIGKYFDLIKTLQNLGHELMTNGSITTKEVRGFIAKFNQEFSEFQVFPDTIVEDYVPLYTRMKSELDIIERGLLVYEKRGLDQDFSARTKMYKSLKNYWETNIIEILKELEQSKAAAA